MDKLSDFLNSIKERIVNPFFVSFIIAWVCWNPKITVGLIWFDAEQIKRAGYTSIFDLIDCQAGIWTTLLLPFLSALVYTGLIGNLVSALNEFTQSWGGDWNLNISKKSSIPTEKYLKLKENFDEGMKALEKIIKDEDKSGELYRGEQVARLKSEADANERNVKLHELQKQYNSVFDIKFLEGRWKCNYLNKLGNNPFECFVYIQNNNLYVEDVRASLANAYTVHNFALNVTARKVFFVKYSTPDSFGKLPIDLQHGFKNLALGDSPIFVDLTIQDENNMAGTENGDVTVSYKRVAEIQYGNVTPEQSKLISPPTVSDEKEKLAQQFFNS